MPAIRLLVCGGRRFRDFDMMQRSLDRFVFTVGWPDCIITGGAPGADFMAEAIFAKSRGIPCAVYKAEWGRFGDDAGPIRNQQMIDEGQPTHGLAMPGGPGTADMLRRLQWAGIPVILGA